MRIGLFLLVLAWPVVSSAQDYLTMQMNAANQVTSPTGADLPKDGPSLRKLAAYGKCLTGRWRNRSLLETIPESEPERHALFGMSWSPEHCRDVANVSASATPRFLRGTAAEYFLKKDFNLREGTTPYEGLKVFSLTDQAKAALGERQRAALSFIEYGSCVAKADRLSLAALFSSEVSSADEKAAYAALKPALGQCLTPGMTVAVNRLKLRGYLAEGAYRALLETASR